MALPDDFEDMRDRWEAIFDESMPWGFEIGEEQVPMLRQCIAERSKAPLQAYIDSIPKNRLY